MIVVHHFNNKKIEKDIDDNLGFLLSNRNGGYLCFFEHYSSRYDGGYINENGIMMKVIEDINIKGNIRKIANKFFSVERHTDNNVETFYMFNNLNSFVYELKQKDLIELILDIRGSYDDRQFGKFYYIYEEKGKIIIEFIKKTSFNEDNSEGLEEYRNYLVLDVDELNYTHNENWVSRLYDYDKERNSWPYERFVFSALNLNCKSIVLSFSTDKNKAIKEATYIRKNLKKLIQLQKKYVNSLLKIKTFKDVELDLAYKNVINAIDGLIDNYGLHGGFPWFFQYWVRDELISLNSLIKIGKYNLVKKIIQRDLNIIKKNGRLPNRTPNNEAENADSTGWLFKRIEDYSSIKKDLKKETYVNKLIQTYQNYTKNFGEGYFIMNNPLETWMDTTLGQDNRAGIRNEIQALRLNMLKFLFTLTKDNKYKEEELKINNHFKSKFWNGKILADGLDDFTIRPNIFLVHYIYPNLLSKKEWEICFKNTINCLWNEWGGLSSIDKNHSLFHKYHTGSDNRSYHRGDSWYYLNNLAAISMKRVNKKKFQPYISAILAASIKDILWKGIIGCHSEISSSIIQDSNGCRDQLWSNAMFIELVNELYK